MKRILVALDDSTRAELVLAAAARLAALSDGKLVLFRAIHVPDEAEPSVENDLKRIAYEQLSQLAGTVRAGMVEEIVTDVARVWDGVVEAGRRHDADLIVIGCHGYANIDHLSGTIPSKIVNHADRNVLVVRTPL